ncbi:Piso0_001000 [Millerozyma farinosa CBS 7064]|uniref:Phosphoribosylglycinamide formyltransferase n=1 Tax=Pichia sorbitophila (strain ATCC MYA-4447 / BCRC 22081 / CBS 7064 / NBRC 10061 / NRRL Y-12695) TaxID=559304 RepID=G8YS41_PICSO|nr:Piso0_001000 [Millerozyma farinosa CBS 7064]CCE78964.1 Piso0_001000 [Millerozyma farinosa CBS 7064]
MVSIVVLISGSGTNLQALIDAEKAGKLNGTITRVISSSDKAYGLQRAAEASIETRTHTLKKYYEGIPKEQKEERAERREKFNEDLAKLLINGAVSDTPVEGYKKPDLIVCAGWMLIFSPTVLEPLAKAGITIINLHPALPGAFDGTHAIERAWKAGQDGLIDKGGVMIHNVIAEVDRGAPILVKEIGMRKEEKLEEYEQRIHDIEHIAIVEGTNMTIEKINSQ